MKCNRGQPHTAKVWVAGWANCFNGEINVFISAVGAIVTPRSQQYLQQFSQVQ